jgi:hypothetical protein
VTDPFITIAPEGIRLAATVQHGAIQTVVSVHFTATADEEQVNLRVLEVNSGSLPIPQSWIEGQAVKFQKRAAAQLNALSGEVARKNIQITDLFKGISIPNRGVWRQVDVPPRPYRVIGLTLEQGALVVTIRPLAQRGSTR